MHAGAPLSKRVTGARCALAAELVGVTPVNSPPRAAGGPAASARPAILADADVLKHIYSFLPAETALEHMLVCREFLRVLSSTVTHLTLSPAAPVEGLLARFANATHVVVVGMHCAVGLRAGARAHADACLVSRLCDALQRCANVQSLDLTRCSPCDGAVAHLCAALPRCAALRGLTLDQWTAPTADAAISLCAALSAVPHLSELSLAMARVRAVQHALVPMLPRYEQLSAIDLSLNGLGAPGAALLRAALPGCAALHSLNLAANAFADVGVEALACALPLCPSLTDLNLSANGVTVAGARALATFMPACLALRHLWLGLNAIGSRGVEHLAAILPCCRKLIELDISSNQLPADAISILVPACFQSPALMLLDARRNDHASSDKASADFVKAVASTRAHGEDAPACEYPAWRLGTVRMLVDAHLSPDVLLAVCRGHGSARASGARVNGGEEGSAMGFLHGGADAAGGPADASHA